MGESVEEEGDKAERQAVGDHACAAVSVLQRETDSEKSGWNKNERGRGKRWVARLLPECDLDTHPDLRLIYPGSIRLHLTLICITHTYRSTYSCAVTQKCMHTTTYSPHGAQFMEGKATFSGRQGTIHHSYQSQSSVVVRACRNLTLMSSLQWGWGC